ncbi:MAG: hypothetical protein HQM09_15180 [Candidatus Riflebacteria bacterium]|nr:hypothetical protein [Candidatus Riflebacteria bacterium]
MGKKLEEYFHERELGVTSAQVLEALKPVFQEIRADILTDFEKIDFSNYQKVDNRECFLLSLKLELVKNLEAGLQRQITNGRSADQTIKEHR